MAKQELQLKEKTQKVHPNDHIGAPNQPLYGTGEGVTEYDMCRIEVLMASRRSTNPEKNGGEGYPQAVKIIDVIKSIKSNEDSINIQNKHVGGCIMASPGMPNHCSWYFPKGLVKAGMTLSADAIHKPYTVGNRTTYNYEMEITLPTTQA